MSSIKLSVVVSADQWSKWGGNTSTCRHLSLHYWIWKLRWNNRNSATSTNSTTPLGRATKTPISHRGSVYHQTVQTVLCSFNLKRLYSLIFIKAVLNNAKTHDAVLKRIKPRFTIKKLTKPSLRILSTYFVNDSINEPAYLPLLFCFDLLQIIALFTVKSYDTSIGFEASLSY